MKMSGNSFNFFTDHIVILLFNDDLNGNKIIFGFISNGYSWLIPRLLCAPIQV